MTQKTIGLIYLLLAAVVRALKGSVISLSIWKLFNPTMYCVNLCGLELFQTLRTVTIKLLKYLPKRIVKVTSSFKQKITNLYICIHYYVISQNCQIKYHTLIRGL